MRKLVCFLAVICFAAPAFAGDITFTVSSSVDKEFTIGYVATDPCEGPVGIGLKVNLTGSCGATVSGKANVGSASSEFPVYIDWAHDMPDPNDYTVDPPPGDQHPLADPCEAGVVDPCSSLFSICMGRLDPCALAPQSLPNLITVKVDCDGECTITVDIEEDGLRGGVVGADYDNVYMVDGTVVCPGGIPPTVPACWNVLTQCRGDYGVPADGSVSLADFYALKDSYGKNYCDDWNGGAGPYNPCADADRNGSVSLADFYALKDHYGTSPPADCPAGGTWPPSCP